MVNYNPKNERIKKDYFCLLSEADQKSGATIDGIRKAIHRFEEFTGFADFASFGKDQAIAFKRHLRACKAERTGKPLSAATIHSTMHAIQAFFLWLAREPGYRAKIKAADIRYLNLRREDIAIARAPRTQLVPTLEQIHAVVLGMPSGTEIERRNQAVIAFAIVTGMRDSAIASLRLKHVDLDQRLVIQDPNEVKTKFSKRIETFFFPVGDELEQIVIDWMRYLRKVKLYSENDPVFPCTKVAQNADLSFEVDGIEPKPWSSAGPIRTIFKEAFTAAGLPYFTPHSFRSTLTIFGERICRTPEQFKAMSQNLGHSSPLVSFTSYGQVPLHRQGELVRNAGKAESREDKLDRLVEMVERITPISESAPTD